MPSIITVDFDGTIAFESVKNTGWICVGTGVLIPIPEVIDFVKEKHNEGFEIHIVTFREDKDIPEIRSFIIEHKLPIKDVHNTSSRSKTPILKKLNSILHLDDSLSVCSGAIMEGINVIYIDWGQKLDESQKLLLCKMNTIKVKLEE